MSAKQLKTIPELTAEQVTRFNKYIVRKTSSECWLWTGYRVDTGYGVLTIGKGRLFRAHRVAYKLSTGIEPGELEVRHSCDNPSCCNPNHLLLGTHSDNMNDAAIRQRLAGEKSGRAKLTEREVIAMRAEYASGSVSIGELSRRSGLHRQSCAAMLKGVNWKHIPVSRSFKVDKADPPPNP